jgi:hypothetical protein
LFEVASEIAHSFTWSNKRREKITIEKARRLYRQNREIYRQRSRERICLEV